VMSWRLVGSVGPVINETGILMKWSARQTQNTRCLLVTNGIWAVLVLSDSNLRTKHILRRCDFKKPGLCAKPGQPPVWK
jgi:hypothetical protein